ncbi:hypothetical protein K7X08_001151 [Anisodus acutangulus]|uniref:Uncharacterized protein n=1 Tax=Anisodus acutangulus TaxID=402998 RepID=A0A9Q1MS92_9SOLA|nr:hypothetical protein K7X08_001151 [Anisodus acutangulus]
MSRRLLVGLQRIFLTRRILILKILVVIQWQKTIGDKLSLGRLKVVRHKVGPISAGGAGEIVTACGEDKGVFEGSCVDYADREKFRRSEKAKKKQRTLNEKGVELTAEVPRLAGEIEKADVPRSGN